jgi:hypothetical protein
MTAAQLSDLIVDLIKVCDAQERLADEGAEIVPSVAELTAIVHNQGDALADETTTRFWVRGADIDRELRIIYTPAVPPGEEIEVTAVGHSQLPRRVPAHCDSRRVRADHRGTKGQQVGQRSRDCPGHPSRPKLADRPTARVGTIRAIRGDRGSIESGGASEDIGPRTEKPSSWVIATSAPHPSSSASRTAPSRSPSAINTPPVNASTRRSLSDTLFAQHGMGIQTPTGVLPAHRLLTRHSISLRFGSSPDPSHRPSVEQSPPTISSFCVPPPISNADVPHTWCTSGTYPALSDRRMAESGFRWRDHGPAQAHRRVGV